MKRILLLLIAVCAIYAAQAQCPANQAKIKIVLKTDNYPQETGWKLFDANNLMVAQSAANLSAGQMYMDSLCVPANTCYHFKITDAAGDGICCGYGQGFFEVYYNGTLVKKDSSFGAQSHAYMGCPPGGLCNTAISVTNGNHTAPGPNTWYSFSPAVTGMYTVTTCGLGNTCNTKLWMYDYCTNLQFDTSNAATIYYAANNCGGIHAQINAYLVATHTYYIRVGDEFNECIGSPVFWSVSYNGVVTGCTDTAACNFNPFATVSNPSSCIYYPSPLCPTGSDLKTDSTSLSASIRMDTLFVDYQNTNENCLVQEGCLNGYGKRELVRFDTRIENIGATDFYAGAPPASQTAYSPIYEWDACHGHWHFEDYAEYLLADNQNNFIPIGYKNGFCVIDLTCSTGSPKFGCNNMGITAGCADIYSSGLACQWVDITDVADGSYKLIVRANWVPRPDFYGRYETTYTNNWARACVTLSHNAAGDRQVVVTPNCAPYIDCNGIENGLAVPDCAGACGGTRLTGDLNIDGNRNNLDVTNYMLGAIYNSLPATKCYDLNDDQAIDVVDAALLFECAKHGGGTIPVGHSHEPCRFPNKIRNPQQSAEFSIGNIDYVARTLDIFIQNPNSKPLAYQLKLGGVTLQTVQNAMTGFTPIMHFKQTGEIIALSNNEVAMQKNNTPTLVARVKFSSIDSNQICIDSVVAVVNEAYVEIDHTVATVGGCISAVPTPNSVGTVTAPKFVMYPNPMTHTTTISVEDGRLTDFSATMYDVLGRVVRRYAQQRSAALVIERDDLPSGVYFIELGTTDWKAKEKFVIQ